MKYFRFIFFPVLVFLFAGNAYGVTATDQSGHSEYLSAKIIEQLSNVSVPFVKDGRMVFTAEGKYRYAGIAFSHEGYRKIHTFERIIHKDQNGNVIVDKNGREENFLFFVTQVPENTNSVEYRLVIDGLWTTDPMNPESTTDMETGLKVSTLKVPYIDSREKVGTENNRVNFVYQGEEGRSISLSGTFNNWDPFMYTLKETRPGFYEFSLPLPPGTYYYTYMDGGIRLEDKTNPDKVYTKDGRIASVIVVQN